MNFQQNNWLLDEVMPNTTGNEFKIIAAVARQSLGWQCGGVVLSLSDFQELTGMSRPSVTSNIEKAIKSGFITQEEHGQGYVYRCVASKETLLVKHPEQLRIFTSDSKETLPEQERNFTSSGKETLPATSSPKEEKVITVEESNAPAPVHFQAFEAQANGYSKTEQPYAEVIAKIVRNPQKTAEVKDLVAMAIGFDLKPNDLWDLFGDKKSFWYLVSHGKKDGLPPYIANIVSDLKTAILWQKQQASKPQEQDENLILELFEQVKAFARGKLSKDKVDPRAQAAVAKDTALYYDIKNNLTNQNERFILDRFKGNLSYVHH